MFSQWQGHLFFALSILKSLTHIHFLIQSIFASQSNWMPQRAVERLTMTQASSAPFFQEQSTPQQSPLGFIAGGTPSGTSQQQMVSLATRWVFN